MAVPTAIDPDTGEVYRLGRVRPKVRPNVLRFSAFADLSNVEVPISVDYSAKAMASISRMYKNDQYGDCVIASAYHQTGIWSGNDGTVRVGSDSEVTSQYQKICGPGDNGCVITEVLDVRKAGRFLVGGVAAPIDGYVAIDWTNKLETQVAIYLFGALCIGINLPSAWTGSNGIWDVTNSGIVGGHDVCTCGYNASGVQICTWGGIKTITWAAWTSKKWLEELYAILAPDWYGSDKLAPCGVDVVRLQKALSDLGNGTIPEIDPAVLDFGNLF